MDHIRLPELGIRGNAHFMMQEKNSREALQPILDRISKSVEKNASISGPGAGETAMKLAGQGCFWVGTERKQVPYGTIERGQMYVQYLIWRKCDIHIRLCWCMAELARCCTTWDPAMARQAGRIIMFRQVIE